MHGGRAIWPMASQAEARGFNQIQAPALEVAQLHQFAISFAVKETNTNPHTFKVSPRGIYGEKFSPLGKVLGSTVGLVELFYHDNTE